MKRARPRPHHVHDRPGAEGSTPSTEKIARRFQENPGGVRDRLCQGVVQADPPRHGPAHPLLSGSSVPAGSAHLAGRGPRRGPQADRCRRHRELLKSRILEVRASRCPSWSHRVGLRVLVPRHRHARRRQRRARSSRSAERLGGQQSGGTREGARSGLEGIQKEFNAAAVGGKKMSLADLIVLGGACRASSRRPRARARPMNVPFTPGPHGRLAGADRPLHSFAALEPKADGFRNYYARATTCHPRRCSWIAPTC
jgi:catalase-peroxidase